MKKQIRNLTTMLLMSINSLYAQEKFRFSDPKADMWLSNDKHAHGAGSYVICDLLDEIMPLKYASGLTVALGLLYEYKDGFFPYEKYGYLGGDGFSYKDLVWDIGGVGLYILKEKLFSKDDEKKKQNKRLEKLREIINKRGLVENADNRTRIKSSRQ